ncbi:hypothetical protein H4R20_001834 [Coemansia guatemalensis]|uniref:Uncharacterized protein n=1 Tax=Coemansia guatemalensis TaxID=2761395 RepID=A0A9W8I529_9FUNG|nr:hypothetical protein H4R20_001834 [Coemansia guatemalensis]
MAYQSVVAITRRRRAHIRATQQQELVANLWAADTPEDREFWMNDGRKPNGTTRGNKSPSNYVLSTPPYLIREASKFRGHYNNVKGAARPPAVAMPPTVVQRLRENYLFFSKWSIQEFYYNCGRAAALARGNYDGAYRMLLEAYAQTTN